MRLPRFLTVSIIPPTGSRHYLTMLCHDMLALHLSVGRSDVVRYALAGNLSPSSCNYSEKGMKRDANRHH